MPNIKGTTIIGTNLAVTSVINPKGAIYKTTPRQVTAGPTLGASSSVSDFGFNASLSNSIYGSSSTVTPLSQSTIYVVKY